MSQQLWRPGVGGARRLALINERVTDWRYRGPARLGRRPHRPNVPLTTGSIVIGGWATARSPLPRLVANRALSLSALATQLA